MKNKIFIKNWLHNKPYNKETSVDIEYLSIANKVYKEFQSCLYIFDEIGVDDNEVADLSIFLTCYLEDLVSDTNFWNTFARIHFSKYNKEIPFYSLNDYQTGEVNLVDIQFLIWYALNMLNRQRFLSPYDSYLTILAELVFEILDYEYDYVEENKVLKAHFILNPNADFYEVRRMIQKLLFETYLFSIDAQKELNTKIEGAIEEYEDDDSENLTMILNSIMDKHTHAYRTKLLAMKGKEWLAEILGKEHALSEPISNISEKIASYFLYKEQNKTHFQFQHVATDTIFDLTKDSFELRFPLDDKHIYYIEMILWKKEWVFSGICFPTDFNADIILDEKSDNGNINKVLQLNEKYMNYSMETIQNQENTFLKKYGSSVLFLKANDVPATLNEFINIYNNSITKDKKNKEKDQDEAIKRQKDKGYLNHEQGSFEMESDENVLLFFNPNTGIEMYNDICSIFPDKENPFYDTEDRIAIKMFLFSDIYPKELVVFFVENYASKLIFFKKDIGEKYLKDLDFLQRFWRPENYFSKPYVTIL